MNLSNQRKRKADLANKIIQNKPHHGMFITVAHRYDLINRVITCGLDKGWRWKAARECLVSQPSRVLDLCCGTGDLAINMARHAGNGVELIGIDYSRPMLVIATKKAERLSKGRRISFTNGDASNLPFPDGYFDCVGISFAFRNLIYKNPLARYHITEILRLLSAGGKCVILESSQPKVKIIRKLFHLYLRWFVSKSGYLLSGNRGAYSYLAESAARFYTSEELKEILVTAGFSHVSSRPLFFGVATIYIAVK